MAKFQPFDVLVFVKDWKPLYFGLQAARNLYWTGDGAEQYINFGLGDKRVVRRVDRLLAVSTWHAQSMCEASGFDPAKVRIVGNGVHLPYFAGREERQRRRLIYTAAPYRGLELLPPIFAALRRKYPDLTLHVFAGLDIYDTDRPFSGPLVEKARALTERMQKMPGVVFHGNVTQQQLARELMQSAVFVYPNTVFETCCITALEALAAGCPVIASANSALPETVGDSGFVIGAEPGSRGYLESFAGAADLLLGDDALWETMSRRALERVRAAYTWEHVCDRFEQSWA